MKIGFIGAGKMGFTMGRHLADYCRKACGQYGDRLDVSGFFSKSLESAKCAAAFTDTKYYSDLCELVHESDILFITTPDGQISGVAKNIADMISNKEEKILVHTSGALSSQVFSGMGSKFYGYSVHPIYAVNSKTESYIDFKNAFITIEGHEKYLDFFVDLYESMGHSVKTISADNKVKYHGAAVFASNLVIGLFEVGKKILAECGFSEDEANQALLPLFINNASGLATKGSKEALTGPIARNDVDTVRKHLEVIESDEREIYRLLSRELVNLVESNNCDYKDMKELLK